MKLQLQRMRLLSGYSSLAGTVLFAAGTSVLVLQPTDFSWWATRLLGVATLLLAVGAIVRRPVLGSRPWHRVFGWAALATLAGHVVVASSQPAFWRWLTPAFPVEIAAGLVAALAFLVTLAAQRSSRLRRRLGPFQVRHIHRIAGYVLVAAAGAHVALIAGMNVFAALAILSGLSVLLAEGFLRERRVMGLAVTLGLFVVAIAAFASGPLATWRLDTLRRAPIDHARFLHTDHIGLACAGCHHNFVDSSGDENCLTCHKRISVSETTRIDRVFHIFCSDCHRTDIREDRKSGPVDNCNGCHG
jgi:hypothetical protein